MNRSIILSLAICALTTSVALAAGNAPMPLAPTPSAIVAAQTAAPVTIPPVSEAALQDGAPFMVSPDGPAMVKLDEDAASVIIGNPAHATAMVENPRLIMVMPGQPGATNLTVLNGSGKVIVNRKVLVGGGDTKTGTLRINRVCNPSATTPCKPVSTYYCRGKCYETALSTETTTNADTVPPAPAPAAAAPQTAAPQAVVEPVAPAEPDTTAPSAEETNPQ